MASQRGAALLLAMIFLLLLSALGSALITTAMMDLQVGENYESSLIAMYLAEAGIELARAHLRNESSPAALLAQASGPDGSLSASFDLDALRSSDDRPLFPASAAERATGAELPVAQGKSAGRYWVWLRNDAADGITDALDTNRVLKFLSIAIVGNARKVIEATLRKESFPLPPEALITDPSTVGQFGSVAAVERMLTVIARYAIDLHSPAYASSTSIGDYGNSLGSDVVVVNGDCTLGPGTGFGLLVVRGTLMMQGAFSWNGLILVVGQGALLWDLDASGQVTGAVVVARTRENDRSPDNILGTLRQTYGNTTVDLAGAGADGILHDASAIARATAGLPYQIIHIRD